MEAKILNWAKENMRESDEDIRVIITDGNLYVETRTGKCFEISEREVRYQATEYLNSEIQRLTDES
jgi:hypothetical protein